MKLKHLNYFDCVYNSLIISKIINALVSKGKKYIQEKLLYQSFFLLTVNSKESAYLILFEILEFLRPNIYVEFKSKKVLKKNILTIVPKKLDYYQQLNQSIKWIKSLYTLNIYADNAKYKLFNEWANIWIHKKSFLLTKKIEVYQYAINNKLNKHYRW